MKFKFVHFSESFLTCKWKYYRRFFFTLVILHLLFVTSISASIISVVKCFQRFHNESIIYLIAKNVTLIDLNATELQRIEVISGEFHFIVKFIQIFNSFAVVFGAFLFIHAIIQASFIPMKKLIWELEIVLNLLTAPCAMGLCIYMLVMPEAGYLDNTHRWIYHVSSILILPIWINLMLIVGRFPRLGCYSLMFTTVLQNFLKVII